MGWLADETGLDRCAANYVPLTPLSFLTRGREVFADREALVYGRTRRTYADYAARVSRLASALAGAGIAPGDVVSTLLPNVPPHAEAHFGVPAAGAVLNAINVRLDADTVAYILGHGGARLILCDSAFVPLAEEAVAMMEDEAPRIVECPDDEAGVAATGRHTTYEDFLAGGDPEAPWRMPQDEWESLALNYTSGTTGRPKGVVYHHRGAYLNAMGQVLSWRMVLHPRYLTIVPLFHCNGWCHTWMMPAIGGTVVCCRDIAAKPIFEAIADETVTHFGGAPIVLNLLVNAKEADRRTFDHVVEVFTAGAPPAPSILSRIEPMGFHVTQVYGLTETYGPATECYWREEWGDLQGDDRAAMKARQGVAMPFMEPVVIWDENGRPLPRDGGHQGEIVMRGNGVMKGYYRNPEATEKAFRGGWFHSEDLAVQHPEGHVQIADRAKDIIISGGENVSSVEVEAAVMAHPAVSLCAVVAMADEKWGEVPCAFVELKDGAKASEAELIAHVRSRLAGFKTPKKVVFRELPKTSTGKIQKFELRTLLKSGAC
ncbi:AMP-binding protein [Wenxinia marina]|uniref:3-methylmercaptopropionyl-CoA ligase n=1 Tax=Wenxinia marina DSM 24838 TaxID=1123501 RepID=A0A0D0QC59_9RHOB|nr:AMP-binding protein [Wenxinia marina]KIQ68538.1 Acyl-CoA synthetase (AMP-forming)/AMP-acid ligase II [Wenxinia marina DSM 24838]GGL66719.1 acyl-CoA synthetase [Wenxinia marina]